MKKYALLIILFCCGWLLPGCDKYLTVYPKTDLAQDEMFKTEEGFKDALTGSYIQMKERLAYGEAMSLGLIERIVSSWDATPGSVEAKLGLFDYSDQTVESLLYASYLQLYKVIAGVNAILANVDKRKEVFNTPGMYETIKAECLAIRAYCHFDVLRLFGPQPSDITKGNQLSYVTTLSVKPHPLVDFNTFKDLLMKDLSDAEALLRDKDNILHYSLDQLKNPGSLSGFNPRDNFLAWRTLRLNYYGIRALQARAWLWFGNKDKAYECAKVLIDAKNNDHTPKFRLGAVNDFTVNRDYTLSCEQVFGLYDFSLPQRYTDMFASGGYRRGGNSMAVNVLLFGSSDKDIRAKYLWTSFAAAGGGSFYSTIKYSADNRQIPMLRMSEMYLIAIETAPVNEAQTLWETFLTARGLPVSALPATEDQLKNQLLLEYRRELYAEGQAFFHYKRMNADRAKIIFAPANAAVNYLLPMPKTELQ